MASACASFLNITAFLRVCAVSLSLFFVVTKTVERFKLTGNRGYPGLQGYLWGRSLLPPGYFAGSCGDAPISVLRRYIENLRSPGSEGKDSGYDTPYIPVLKDGGVWRAG
ncbi:MAG: transposase [Desulfovibrio sp.]|nr:transposase [Desulfovibrio sp.]